MTLSIADRFSKAQKIRVLPVAGKDPESQRSERIKVRGERGVVREEQEGGERGVVIESERMGRGAWSERIKVCVWGEGCGQRGARGWREGCGQR